MTLQLGMRGIFRVSLPAKSSSHPTGILSFQGDSEVNQILGKLLPAPKMAQIYPLFATLKGL
jgi:hypothetical protein